MNNTEYALDTARAKTPAERLRIVADLCEAQDRNTDVYAIGSDGVLRACGFGLWQMAAADDVRLVTKRRPALVIPALELFELPMREAPERGDTYYLPTPINFSGFVAERWENAADEREWLALGFVFRTKEPAAAIGLHIRNELAKAVAK